MEYDRQHAISEEFHLGHFTTPLEASRATNLSRESLLHEGQAALALQASAQSSVNPNPWGDIARKVQSAVSSAFSGAPQTPPAPIRSPEPPSR